MSKQKTNVEQLTETLEQFSPDALQKALSRLQEKKYPIKSYKDFDDPGSEVLVGQDRRVALEDIEYLERIIAEPNFLPVHFLEEGAIVQKSVARVILTVSHAGLPAGSGWGTGFLVSPSLFMTNNHVIPSKAFARKVKMQFNYQLDYKGNPQSADVYSPDPDDVFYTNAALDFTLVRLDPHCRFIIDRTWPLGVAAPEYTPNPFGPEPPIDLGLPIDRRLVDWTIDWTKLWKRCTNPGQFWGYLQLSDAVSYAGPAADKPGQHLNIIQHPYGRRKEVSCQRNNLTNIYSTRVRYTSDTEPGSSGSPVFNNQWDLIAIHHAAGTRDVVNSVWLSNEGMRIDKIVADLRNHYSGTTTGNQILSELGI